MTTMTYDRKPNTGVFLLLFIVCAIVVTVSVMFSVQHAVERHGDQMTWVIRTSCESNPLANRTRASDGRYALGCEYQDGKFGVSIYEEDGDFVTAFRNKAKTLDDLIRYLERQGYLQ